MNYILKILFVILFIGTIFVSIEANNSIKRIEEHQSQVLNPAFKMLDSIYDNLDELLTDIAPSSSAPEIVKSKKPILVTIFQLWMYENNEFNNIIGSIFTATFLWLVIGAISAYKIYRGYDGPGWIKYSTPIFIAIFIIALMYGAYFGLFILFTAIAILAGVFSTVAG